MKSIAKNVLVLSKYYKPHIGGVEKHLENISELLIKRKYRITIITEKYQKWLQNKETVNGVKVVRIAYPKIKYIGLFFIWVEMFKLRNLIEKSDIVHIHDVAIWYLPFKILYPNKKVLLTVQGWEGDYPIPLKNRILKQLSIKIGNRTIIVGEYLEKHYGISGDEIIFGAVDTSKILRRKKDAKLIIYVGRLAKDTGLEVFLKALKNKKYKVEFCGDGPLSEQCKKYGKVHGFVDPSPYMAKAYVCFASGYLTIIEALANKCVVIAAYNNKIRKDILELTPFSDFIYKVNNTKKVEQALSDGSHWASKTKLGYNWAKKQNWEAIAALYEREYNSLI